MVITAGGEARFEYARRRPEETALFQVMSEHLDEWLVVPQ